MLMKSKINANRALVAKKAKLTKLFTLLTILTLGITNVWGVLTAHTPGTYDQTVAKGGYGCTLTTVASGSNAGTFEVYYFSANSKYGNTTDVYGGESRQQYRLMCADGDSEYQLINTSSTSTFTKSCDWIEMAYTVTGFSKSDYSYSSAFNEFFAVAPNGGNTSNTKTCFIKPKEGDVLTLKVSGYEEFAILGADNGSSKYMTITVDGGTPTSWKSNTLSRRAVSLTTGEHTIVVACVGNSANNFYGFSLKVPSCDATAPGNISKGALVAGELTLTAAGTPATDNVWYWQSSATGEDKTTSGASITVTAAGTYYIRSLYDDDCWSSAKSFEVKATDLVENYTVIYKDGTEELKRETVEVGQVPAAYTPTKDCYTFANWDVDPSTLGSTAANAEVTLTASWTPIYSTSATLISDENVSAKANVNTIFAASNIVSSITFASGNYEFTSNETKKGYYGYKDKQSGDYMKILLQQGKKVQVLFGNLGADPTITINGVAGSLDAARATGDNAENTFTYTASAADALISITMGSGTNTLKQVTISQLYDATLVDAKSDASGSETSVSEVTLPTPTTISGWTYTGWIANQDVKDSEDNTKTAGTLLPAGTYTLLANTTFTAQWTEASGTYDITYVSAHGTAPVDANAASVVLDELSESGWAHKGWTADVDVTVDAATVTAGDLIENGKTVILAGNVTFTAVWNQIFTLTFDSNEGSAVAEQHIENGEHPEAVTAPTKDNYVFVGWSETNGGDVVADITALTITGNKTLYAKWALDVQITELVFSNSFKAWIKNSTVTVFYMAGESAPTIVSYDGTNLKAADAVSIVGDEVVAIGSDDSEKHYTLTMTAVSPLTTAGAHTFDGTEGYVKTPHAWTADKKWKMSKYAEDGRIARGECSMYFFLEAAESVTFTWGAQKATDDVAVYVNGTFVKNIGKNNNSAIPLTGGNNMVAFYTLQTSGDIYVTDLNLAAYVPTTGIALQEGEDPISSKTIWESTNFTLTAIVTPDNASDKTITWTSSDDAIATVANGVVTGVAASATPVTITATTVDGVSATCEVTVTEAPSACETPVIGTQPAGVAYCAGSEPTLTVAASVGEGTLHYAWFKDDVAIGTDAATCLVDGAGTYKVVVTNHVDGKLDASVTSDEAVVTLNVAAAITTQPTNKSEIVSGSSVTLSIEATNATSYQWYSCDDAEKTNAAAIAGAEAADYIFTCTANGYYYCAVGSACGDAVLSNVVSVKLEPVGCNTLSGTIPTEAPYIYDNSEWTLYAVTSGGKLDGTSRFKDAKDFDDNTVKVIEYGRVGMTFAKDVESLTFYATASSTGRTINSIQVTSDDITTGTPSYSAVTASLASTTMPGQTKQYIFTADNMLLEAGKKYWITFSGTVDIFKICYTEGLAKPVIPTLSNQELCSGESYAEIDATSTKTGEGTLSYQWYDATDEEHPVVIDGANSATFTPTADGKYYVEVTNAAAGHVSNKAKSNTINVAHFASAEITTAPENQRKDAGQEATLTVVASGKNLHYAWKESATIDGTYTDVAGAADAASLTVEVTAGMDKYYKVVVSSDCGAAVEAIARVEEWTELPQVAVSANTTWDMANVADAAINLKDDFDPSRQNERLLLANLKGVNNNATFNAQALMFEGQHIGRTSDGVKHLAGRYLQFNVTVPGVVFVTFASNGSNQRTISINGNKCTETTDTDPYIIFATAVNAGSVEIIGYEGENANQYVRISKVVFKATPDYKRDASTGDDWMAPGELGTICIPNGAVATGGDLYTLEGKNSDGKIVFATVPNNRMTPGKPYLFQATSTAMNFFYTDEDAATNPDNSGAMKSTFEDGVVLSGDDLNGVYYFNGHALWNAAALTELPVVKYRAYVKMDEVTVIGGGASGAPGRRYIIMDVHGQNATTGFGEVQGDDVQCTKVLINGQLFILRGEKMYDTTGRLVK